MAAVRVYRTRLVAGRTWIGDSKLDRLLAGYAYWVLDQVLPAQRGGGGRGGGQGGSYIPTPGFLQNLLPDSLDPALEDRTWQTATHDELQVALYGTLHAIAATVSRPLRRLPSPTSIASALGAGARSLNPFRSRGSTSTSGAAGAGPSREEMLAAAERRLRASQAGSIVSRNAAEPKPAGSNTAGTTSVNARPQRPQPGEQQQRQTQI